VRVYLMGEIQVEADGLLRESDLPARQGRLAFAYLADRRAHPVPRDELAEVLWPERLPPSWDVAVSALVSKLRAALGSVGFDRDHAIESAFGCYQLALPTGAWVDLEAAGAALHRAESDIAAGRALAGYGDALVALTILRRPFLPGATGPWVESRRAELRAEMVRALEAMVTCLEANGERALALRDAEELVAMEPFRESGYRHLMRLHAGGGDRAEALRVYELCKARLRDELGVAPSAVTEAEHLALLKG